MRLAAYAFLALLVLLLALHAAFAWGPFGLRAEYRRRVDAALAALPPAAPPVTEAELAPLPPAVQRYLRAAGVVGQPRPAGFRARMSGRIRGAADAPWMPFTAEQHNIDQPPQRYFFMTATRAGLPLDGLHAYDAAGASMRIRLLSTWPVVTLGGDVLTRTETVTLLNDRAIMSPAALLDPAITWRELSAQEVEATLQVGPHRVRAVLVFGTDGLLADFRSDDRPALAADGVTLVPQRWSTPVAGYRAQGPYRLASRGEGRYAAPGGEYAYIEFDGIEITPLAGPRSGR